MNLKKIIDSRRVQQGLSFMLAAFLIGSVSFLGVRYYNSSSALTGASMQMTPASGSYAVGSDVSFTIREDSGSIPVNTVQASLTYNASQLQFVSITEGGAFPLVAATSTGQPGVIRVARGIQGATRTGDRPIVTVNFKVLAAGNATVAIDRAFSSIVRASDNQNVLEAATNGTYTLAAAAAPAPAPPAATPPPPSGTTKPVLNLLPNGGTYAKGATVPVAVRVKSPSAKVTVVRAVVKYPANLLEFQGSADSPTFPTANQLKKVGDTVDFTRGVAGGQSGVTGDNLVITLNFKVIGSAGSMPLTFTGASEVYDNSGSGTNILDLMGSKGTLYGIGAAGTTPPPPAAGPTPPGATPPPPASNNPTGGTRPIVRASGALTFTPSKSGSASITADNNTQISGSVQLDTLPDPDILAANPGDLIVKVEYYLDKKLIATKTESPFTHTFDTKSLKNGSYVMTVKTFYQSGTVDTNTDNLQVKNPVTLSYVMANYGTGILGTVVALAVVAVVAWKFLLPRFLAGREVAAVPATSPDGGPAAPLSSSDPSDWAGIAPDPAVIAPNGPGDTSTVGADNVLASEQEAAAMTQPIEMQNPQVVTPATPPPAAPLPPSVNLSSAPAPAGPADPAPAPVVPPVPTATPQAPAAPVESDLDPAAISGLTAPVPPSPATPAAPTPVAAPTEPVTPTDPNRPGGPTPPRA